VDSIGEPGARRALYQLARQTATTPVVLGLAVPVSRERLERGRAQRRDPLRSSASSSSSGSARDTDPERADYIRVEFAMVPEFERHRGYLQELYWTTLLKVRPFWQQSTQT
jgi:hypothetical protein